MTKENHLCGLSGCASGEWLIGQHKRVLEYKVGGEMALLEEVGEAMHCDRY